MEPCLLHHHHHTTLTYPSPLSSPPPPPSFKGFLFTRPISVVSSSSLHLTCRPIRRAKIKASAGVCSLNSPLEPRSLVGKFLSGVLQNHRQLFHVAVGEELKLLADDRDAAHARLILASDSDESLLHRFVAKSWCPFLLPYWSYICVLLLLIRVLAVVICGCVSKKLHIFIDHIFVGRGVCVCL